MASVNFANASSGPLAAGIGWFDFTGVSLAPNTSLNLTNTLPNGGSISFTISNTNTSGITYTAKVAPVYGGIPFGTTNYTGIGGKPILDATVVSNGHATLAISNLSVTNQLGATIPFGLVVAEGEGSVVNESWTWNTDGTPWKLIANIYGSIANITGINTTSITWGGANPWPSPVVSTNNPTTITGFDFENVNSAIALGVILTPIKVEKSITDRIDVYDQFIISITGNESSMAVTSGSSTGLQPNYASVYGQDGVYTIDEFMLFGSTSTLSQYITSVSIVNSSLGGTTIPAGWTLGTPLTLTMGDNINVLITNTPNNPSIKLNKVANKNYAAILDLINYTIYITNTSPNIATNPVLIDTTPNGATYIPSSLKINGVPLAGDPNPPGLILPTLPANSVIKISYDVSVDNNYPIINPIKNSALINYSYLLASPTVPLANSNSNITSTTIVTSILGATKLVDQVTAAVGDILTYTIPITNYGNTTATSVSVTDFLPVNTAYLIGTLKQDGVTIPGYPQTPAITLPNSIAPLAVSTVTFQVKVTTPPNINPISNYALVNGAFVLDSSTIPNIIGAYSTLTNTVYTNLTYADLVGITEAVDKDMTPCGGILTYTITLPNTGNLTATNIILFNTIPAGGTFIDDSVTIDGVTQYGYNPDYGMTIPDISPGDMRTVTFQMQVNC